MHLPQILEPDSRPTTPSPENGVLENEDVPNKESGDSGSACHVLLKDNT